ncbi:type IV secretion system protein [Anaplasmataceae bacterium AB001_6]|nr:type IV secretion system protein [Anaplasmataceae bacterium AB001_6]
MLGGLLRRTKGKLKNSDESSGIDQEVRSKSTSYDWYDDKIHKVVLQRNFMVLFVCISLIIMIVIVISIMTIASFKSIEPFVIEISSKSGMATLVEPATVKQYSADRKVIEYFLFQYLKARELFDSNTYKYNYYRVVRLFSSGDVYSQFRKYVSTSNPDSPVNLYSKANGMVLKIRSIQYLDLNNIQVRFALLVDSERETQEVNRVANVKYVFKDEMLSEEDRYINPLGFTITSYKVDSENIV